MPRHYDDQSSNRRMISTNRANPCPICGDTSRRCRITGDLILCCSYPDSSGISGYRFIKTAANPRWGIHAPSDGQSDYITSHQYRREREDAEKARRAEMAEGLSEIGRHLAYRKLSEQLNLYPEDRANLLARGISPEQIERYRYRSIEARHPVVGINPKLPGINESGTQILCNNRAIIFPIPDKNQRIIGWQYRDKNPKSSAKYLWPRSKFSSHLPNGELPIGWFAPDKNIIIDNNYIGLCEGFSKAPAAANKMRMNILGAASANFAGSPEQMRKYLTGFQRAILFADAGSTKNPNIIATYRKSVEFCRDNGVSVSIAWYGQFEKSDGDIDDIDLSVIHVEYLEWEQWLELCDSKIPTPGHSEKAALTHFSPNQQIHSRYFPENFSIPESVNLIAIKGAKGTGKTQFLSRLNTAQKTLILTHRVCLESDLANVFRLDTRHNLSRAGQLLGHALCINSLHPFANPSFNYRDWDGADLIMDEFDQLFLHLTTSSTCQIYKSEIIDTWINLMKFIISTGGKIFISSADLSDLHSAFIEDILGFSVKKFSLENTYIPYNKERELYVYQTKLELLTSVEQALESKKRILLFTTSVGNRGKFATRNLEKYFTDTGYSVLRADSESVSTPDHAAEKIFKAQAATSDAQWFDALREYDLVIASPVLETGVSIISVFDAVYYVSQSGIQSVNSVGQSLARERANVPRHLYVPRRTQCKLGNKKTRWLEIYHEEKKRANELLVDNNNYALIGVDFTNTYFHRLYCQSVALQNIGFLNYREEIIDNSRASGYTVRIVPKSEKNKVLEKKLNRIKKEQYSEYCENVANSAPLPEPEKAQMQKKQRLTDTERLRLKRENIAEKFAEPTISSELVAMYDDGFYEKIKLHYFLTVGFKFIELNDIKKIEKTLRFSKNQIFEPDLLRIIKAPIVNLLQEIGILQFIDTENEFTNESLGLWWDMILSRRSEISKILGITNFNQKPIAWLNQQLLPRLGLKLISKKKTRINGKQIRIYGGAVIDDDRSIYFERWEAKDSLDLEKFNLEKQSQAIENELTAMILKLMRASTDVNAVAIKILNEFNGRKNHGVRAEILNLSTADKWELYAKLS